MGFFFFRREIGPVTLLSGDEYLWEFLPLFRESEASRTTDSIIILPRQHWRVET